MNVTTLVRGTAMPTTALVAAALVWAAAARDTNTVDRSFKIKADVVMVVSLADGTTVGGSEGEASGLGNFVVHFTGTFNPAGGFEGKGFAKTPHGLIFFTMPNGGWAEFQGGTGPFARVTGGHTLVPTATPEQSVVDGKLIVTYSYTGEGTMSY